MNDTLRSKMMHDFEREGFKAGLSARTVAQSIWYYDARKFLDKFLLDHPEYVQYKDEYPLVMFSERAKVFDPLYDNPAFIAHLDGLKALCKEFDEQHPIGQENDK